MNRSLFNECTGLFVIFLFNFNVYTNDQIKTNDNPVEFSSDFEGFLKDLGSILNKSKSRPPSETLSWKQNKHDLSRKTTPSARGSGKVFNSQKAALNDVLMMKLVSYYEDKYRLAHHETPMAHSITLTDHFDRSKTNKYDMMDVFDRDDGKKKKSNTIHSNLGNVMYNTHSSGANNEHMIHGVVNGPEQVEEVLNVMEYLPPTGGRHNNLDNRFIAAERIQNVDDYSNHNNIRSEHNLNYKSPSEEIIHDVPDYLNPNIDVVNYDVTKTGKVKLPNVENVRNIYDHTSPNFERSRNIQGDRLPSRQVIRKFNEDQYPNHDRVSNINDYASPNIQKIRNTMDNRHPPSERVRNIEEDRPRNIGRVRNILDFGSSEDEGVRHTVDNRFAQVERERGTLNDRSPNVDKVHNMDSPRPNVERMRIIIGTSPVDKTAANRRKSNNDNSISEVIVI